MNIRVLGLGLMLALWSGAVADRVWDREVLPGVVFRMERLEAANLNVYGVKLAKGAVKAESVLAGGTIYDGAAANGRGTVSQMVAENNATGGVNGDFFQWGNDPGGDPAGAMMRFGEWLSNPSHGGRYAAYGWGPGTTFEHLDLRWNGEVELPSGGRIGLDNLNARVDAGQAVLLTGRGRFVYGQGAYTMVRLKGADSAMGVRTDLELQVLEVWSGEEKREFGADEWVLAASGEKEAALKSLRAGQRIRVRAEVTGADWSKIDQVMGGGPVLVRDGEAVVYPESDSFATTKHPRTAVGVTAEGDVWFLVADGRQTQSEGIGLNDLGQLMKRWGCVQAMNLDGGGSSAIHLLGLTLNKPSGGVERAVANGVVWHSARPMVGDAFEIVVPRGEVAVGGELRLGLRRAGADLSVDRAVWTAQGDGWVDQDGVLRGLKEGSVTVAVLVEGRIERVVVRVAGGG